MIGFRSRVIHSGGFREPPTMRKVEEFRVVVYRNRGKRDGWFDSGRNKLFYLKLPTYYNIINVFIPSCQNL